MQTDAITSVTGLIKIAAIVFQTIHILAVLLLVREVFRMNRTLHTSYSSCFVWGMMGYVMLMVFVLILIALY